MPQGIAMVCASARQVVEYLNVAVEFAACTKRRLIGRATIVVRLYRGPCLTTVSMQMRR
jgi:hypothetical protein